MKNKWLDEDVCGVFTKETFREGIKEIERLSQLPIQSYITEPELDFLTQVLEESIIKN